MKTLATTLAIFSVACGNDIDFITSHGIKVSCESDTCYSKADVEYVIDLALAKFLEVTPNANIAAIGGTFAMTSIKFTSGDVIDCGGIAAVGCTSHKGIKTDVEVLTTDECLAEVALGHEMLHVLLVAHDKKGHPYPYFEKSCLDAPADGTRWECIQNSVEFPMFWEGVDHLCPENVPVEWR